jgi:hypothetical protein
MRTQVPVTDGGVRVGTIPLTRGMITNRGVFVGDDPRGLAMDEADGVWYYDPGAVEVPADEARRHGWVVVRG